MLTDPVDPIAIPHIDRVKTLPYWETYQQWTDHLDECVHCATVMVEGSQEIPELCLMGRFAATAVEWDIDTQRQLSRFN